MTDPPNDVMTINRSPDGGRLFLAGELDMAGAQAVEDAARRALVEGPLVVDLSALTFIDSSGLRVIDALLHESRRHGWVLRFAGALHPGVRRALEITGMLEALPMESPPG